MWTTPDPADQLLDGAVARLKTLPVPDYPGPPRLNRPHPETPPRAARPQIRGGVLVLVCSVLVLAVAGVILPTPRRTSSRSGLTNVVQHPVRMRTVVLDDRFRAIEHQLDAISLRLNEIDDEIVTQELLSDARSLAAQYSTSEPESP